MRDVAVTLQNCSWQLARRAVRLRASRACRRPVPSRDLLERDLPARPRVPGEEHHRHAAAADVLEHLVGAELVMIVAIIDLAERRAAPAAGPARRAQKPVVVGHRAKRRGIQSDEDLGADAVKEIPAHVGTGAAARRRTIAGPARTGRCARR